MIHHINYIYFGSSWRISERHLHLKTHVLQCNELVFISGSASEPFVGFWIRRIINTGHIVVVPQLLYLQFRFHTKCMSKSENVPFWCTSLVYFDKVASMNWLIQNLIDDDKIFGEYIKINSKPDAENGPITKRL